MEKFIKINWLKILIFFCLVICLNAILFYVFLSVFKEAMKYNCEIMVEPVEPPKVLQEKN